MACPMRGLYWYILVLALAIGLAGCIGSDDIEPAATQTEDPTEAVGNGSHVVVAVIDTGINFYHEEFHAEDRWSSAPQTAAGETSASKDTLPVDTGVDPLAIEPTFDAEDWESAVEADEEQLMEIEPETLYTFPGTKILGGISFQEASGDTPLILDYGGHGTMTASRATGNTVAVGGDDPGIWVVAVQGFTPEAVTWAAQQDWIDMISISSGLSLGGLAPGVANVEAQEAIEAFDEASHAKPLFASSGNGVGNVGMAGFPSWLRGASGVPDAVSVGATDNANMAQWDNQDSYIAADGCSNPAAEEDSLDAVTMSGGGTSSATPYSAGGAAKMLIEARRTLNDTELGPRVDEELAPPEGAWDSGYEGDAHVVLAEGQPPEDLKEGPLADGVFTMREFKDVLYHTALVTPTEDDSDGEECGAARNGNPFGAGYVPASAVPEDARFPFQGYGEINVASIDASIEVLQAGAEMPERGMDDWHYERAHSHKKTFVTGEPELPGPPGTDPSIPQR